MVVLDELLAHRREPVAVVRHGALSVGTAVVFLLATRDIFTRFEDLAGAVGDAREAHVRLAEFSYGDGGGNNDSGGGNGGRRIIAALPLTVPAGDRSVIAGETGSGKSTLVPPQPTHPA